MDKAVLFLAGKYLERDTAFYRGLARGCFKVAVDGGWRFFERSGLTADLLIGDFDSLRRPRNLPTRTKVLEFPTDKDKTDSELALDFCLAQGARCVDIVQPSMGDPDHFLANLFLLTRPISRRRKAALRLVSPTFEAFYVSDGAIRFKRAKGSVVSVIPVSGKILLSCRGTAFDVSRVRIGRGETRPARNRVVAAEAHWRIDGQAFVVRLFGRS
jgi:thiamine pyrophosphokinase